jgi:uncharacterized membrane protein YhaH (DUF805 family)
MNWFLRALHKKYATFSGRAQRAEYWFFVLFSTLLFLVFAIIDITIGTYSEKSEIGLFSGIGSIALFIPGFAVTVRRFHDIGRSGWWLATGLIPLIGAIILLVFTLLDSEAGENIYGPNPKEL